MPRHIRNSELCTFFECVGYWRLRSINNVRYTLKMCIIHSWAQMCLGSNNVHLGFIRHILIGQLGRNEKRNVAILLCCLHLRPTTHLSQGFTVVLISIFYYFLKTSSLCYQFYTPNASNILYMLYSLFRVLICMCSESWILLCLLSCHFFLWTNTVVAPWMRVRISKK
jgi:hypothetical protein